MKKTFKVLALAVVSMMVAVACNNAPEATEDTTAIDSTPVEAVVEDTTPVLDTVPAVEETPAPAKKTTKKTTDKKVDNNTSAADQTLDKAKTGTGTISVNKNTKNTNGTSAADQSLDKNKKGAGSISLKKN